MNRLLVMLAFVTAVFSSACVVGNDGEYYGSAYYNVQETDYVIDQYGYQRIAFCTGDVRFSGWFDSACNALTASEARYADLYCEYYDSLGYPWYYYQNFYFPYAYISETCTYYSATQSFALESTTPASSDDRLKLDPRTQPEVLDGQLHAIISGRVGPMLVDKKLGKNETIEEFLAARKSGLTRARNESKPIEK